MDIQSCTEPQDPSKSHSQIASSIAGGVLREAGVIDRFEIFFWGCQHYCFHTRNHQLLVQL